MSIDFSCNYGLGNLFLNPYSDSSGIMTFSSSNPSVASFVNEISNNLNINNIGITTINIRQNTNDYYNTNDVSFKLQVLPSIDYRLLLNLPSYVQYIDTSFNLSSYTTLGNSRGKITYSIINQKTFNNDTPNIASIDSNNIITFLNHGRMNIQLLQEATGNYDQQIIVSPEIYIPPKAFINIFFSNIQYKDTSLNLNNAITHNNPTSVIKYQLDTNSVFANLASIDSNNIISFKNIGNIQINAKIDACMNNIELYSANNTIINVGIYGKGNIAFISDPSRQYIGNSLTLNSNPIGNTDISTNNINSTINYTVYDYNIYTNTQLDTSNNATIENNRITFKSSGTVILIATIPTYGIYYTCSTSKLITIYPEATIDFTYPFISPYGYYNNTGLRISNYITSNSSGTIVYDISSTNNCIVLNNAITGDVSFTNLSTTQDQSGIIQIYQSAWGTYSSVKIRQPIIIYKRSNISFISKLANQIYNNNLRISLNQYYTSNSNGSLTFSVSDPNGISTLTNATTTGDLYINNIGNLSLFVRQDAQGIYSANDTSMNVNVSRGNVLFTNSGSITITYGTNGTNVYNPSIRVIDASSGLPVSDGNTTYTSYKTNVDTIDNNSGIINVINVGTDTINIIHSNTNKYYDNSINIPLSIVKAATPLFSSFNFTDFSNNLNTIFYKYGKTIPIMNPTTTLVGSSDFKYNYSTTSSDISINKIIDNCFNILVINAKENIPINVSLISSNNYNTGFIYNTNFTINKYPIILPTSFQFSYHDVSYTGGSYIIPAPRYNEVYDFSYTYQAITSNISVSSAIDGSCVVYESSGNNATGVARIRAIQGTSNNYVVGTKIELSYTIRPLTI